ncbi:MAG: hypothetical protein ACRDV4_10310, partial [Acidimicrobiales bacterium]
LLTRATLERALSRRLADSVVQPRRLLVRSSHRGAGPMAKVVRAVDVDPGNEHGLPFGLHEDGRSGMVSVDVDRARDVRDELSEEETGDCPVSAGDADDPSAGTPDAASARP